MVLIIISFLTNLDYGGNMGLEGNLPDLTTEPLYALENTASMAGVGLAMEGQEGNEVATHQIIGN